MGKRPFNKATWICRYWGLGIRYWVESCAIPNILRGLSLFSGGEFAVVIGVEGGEP